MLSTTLGLASISLILATPQAQATDGATGDRTECEVRVEFIEAEELTRLWAASGDLLHETSAKLESMRRIEIPEQAGFVHTWSEVSEEQERSHYLIQRAETGFARVRETDHLVHMKRGVFDPLLGAPSFEESPWNASGDLHLVQFVCPPLVEFRQAVQELGAEVLDFIPEHTRLLRMDAETLGQVRDLPFVRWVGPYHGDYRLEDELLSALKSKELEALTRCQVEVFEEGLAEKSLVATLIESQGGQVTALHSEDFLLEAQLTPELLQALAVHDSVLWIDRYQAPEEDLNHVRNLGGANQLESLEGFTGQGVRGEVLDGNVRASHIAFQSNPLILHGSKAGSSDHGTKVTGIIFGDGSGQISARGLLPDGQGIFADHEFLSNRASHTAQLLTAPYFAVFQSNSWGSGLTVNYTSLSSQLDNITFNNDITILQSQSNEGTQSSRPQAWAKNVISVGGVYHNNNSNPNDDSWSGSASIGPAADGRIKPDLCFWYDSIWTTDNESDSDYNNSFCCTSAATPCVAGYVGLVQQMWSEGIFGNFPVGNSVFDRRAKATTVRALMVNSATQYSFNGLNHDRTRTHQGWGVPDVGTLHDNRKSVLIIDESEVLSEGQVHSYQVNLLPGQTDFKATLVFLDPAGTTSSSQHRVNDLSLRVTSPNNTIYWGNNGLLSGNWSSSGGSSNKIDVIENVFVQNAQAGTWTVDVLADEINQDSHVETGALDADYSLVVSGVEGVGFCPPPASFCSAKLSSLGTLPEIGYEGIPRVSDNDFDINVTLAAPQKTALVFWGAMPANIPFQAGTLCVQSPQTRGAPKTTDVLGAATWNIDLSTKTPGDAESYQVWFRDPAEPSGFGTGLSNGLTVTYCD